MSTTKIYRDKRYISINRHFMVAGVLRNVDFNGGAMLPIRINGSFRTNEVNMQIAIESHPRFNKDFFLEKTIEEKKPEPETKKKPEQPEQPEQPVKDDKSGVEVVESVDSLAKARKYFMEKYDHITARSIPNKAVVLKLMEKYNVEFPNWNS